MAQAIKNVTDLRNVLNAGPYAWPGGYPVFFVTSDGAALSFESVSDEIESVTDSIENKIDDGWRVIATDINYEDSNLFCDHSGERIESAYGDDEDEDA